MSIYKPLNPGCSVQSPAKLLNMQINALRPCAFMNGAIVTQIYDAATDIIRQPLRSANHDRALAFCLLQDLTDDSPWLWAAGEYAECVAPRGLLGV